MKNLSTQEVLQLCKQNQRDAWEEFFRRYIPILKKAINHTLISYEDDYHFNRQDSLWEIHEKIVKKLLHGKILDQCQEQGGVIVSWLNTIATNQTLDWLKRQGRKKRLPQKHSQKTTISLFAPLSNSNDLILLDTLSGEEACFDAQKTFAEDVLEKADKIKDENKKWILRLSIISRLSLSEDETLSLKKYSPLSEEEFDLCLEELLLDIEKKEKKRRAELGKSVLLWHEIRKLEAKYNELSKSLDSDESPETKKILDEIEHKSERKSELLVKGNSLSIPKHQYTAKIIGLSGEKVNQVSNLLKRARQALRREMQKMKLNEKYDVF